MADVFISYAQGDREWVKAFAAALEAEGFSVWWDPNLLPGSSFREIIKKEMANAKAVVVIWSHLSVGSDWVLGEADEARTMRKLIPVLRESVRPPTEFRSLHTADLSQWRGRREHPEFRRVVSALQGLVGSLPAPMPSAPEERRPGPHKSVTPSAGPDRRPVPRGSAATTRVLAVLCGFLFALVPYAGLTDNYRFDAWANFVYFPISGFSALAYLTLGLWLRLNMSSVVRGAIGLAALRILSGIVGFVFGVFFHYFPSAVLSHWQHDLWLGGIWLSEIVILLNLVVGVLCAVVAWRNDGRLARRFRPILLAGLAVYAAAWISNLVWQFSDHLLELRFGHYFFAVGDLRELLYLLITALAVWQAPHVLPRRD
jgi:hypothetical protein